MFRLPRRKREPFDENRAQVRHIIELENTIMSALETAVSELRSAIESANSRFQNVGEFEAKLAEERRKYDELVSAEAAEDVQQEEELTAARAATDAALAELQGTADVLSGLTEQVNTLGTVAADEAGATDEVPTDAEPTPEPAPADAPVDTPAPAVDDAAPANAAPVPASGAASDPASTENMKPNL